MKIKKKKMIILENIKSKELSLKQFPKGFVVTNFGGISIFPSFTPICGIYRKSLLISRDEDDTGSLMTRGEGVLLGILRGGLPPGSSNPDSFLDQRMVIFYTRFQKKKSIPVLGPCL